MKTYTFDWTMPISGTTVVIADSQEEAEAKFQAINGEELLADANSYPWDLMDYDVDEDEVDYEQAM